MQPLCRPCSFGCLLTSPPHKKRTLRAGHPLWLLHTARRLLAKHPLPLPQKSRSSNALGSTRNPLSQPNSFFSRLQASPTSVPGSRLQALAPAPVPNSGSRLQALALDSQLHFTNPLSLLSATLPLVPTLQVFTVRRLRPPHRRTTKDAARARTRTRTPASPAWP